MSLLRLFGAPSVLGLSLFGVLSLAHQTHANAANPLTPSPGRQAASPAIMAAEVGAPGSAGGVAPASDANGPTPLSMTEAVRVFRERGFDLLLADTRVRAAEGDLRAAGAVANPALTGSVSRALGYDPSVTPCDGCSATGFAVGLSDQAAIENTLSGKRGLKRDVARLARDAARLDRADAARVLVAAVKTQYVQTAAARERLEFAREVMASLSRTLELENARFMKLTNEGQLARIELEALRSQQEVTRAERDLRQEEIQLAFLLGERGPTPHYEVDRSILHRRTESAAVETPVESLVKDALASRPDFRGAAARLASADSNVALQRRLRVPDIAVNVQYSQMGNGQNAIQPPTVSAGLSLPLPIFYQQQGEIRRAEADREAQRVTREKLAATVRDDVEAAAATLQSEREILLRFDKSLLERAQRARDITNIQHAAGAIPLMDTLDAQRTWVQVNVEYQAELVNYWTAVFQLEAAVGKELVP